MNLDDFADYWVWEDGDIPQITLRHNKKSCDYWQDQLETSETLGANLKYLMIKATEHYMEKHNGIE
jgi:hypothetical protein